jgi:hypothetical protein
MDYTALIRQAWTITWRYRFLWLLGVLAGGAVGMPTLNAGGGSGWHTDQQQINQMNPAVTGAGEQVATWAAANVGLLVGLALVGVALMLALLVLSLVAQGGMAQATADLATGHASSLRRAWGVGVHLFWRYVGLWLILIGVAISLAAAVGAVTAAVAVAAFAGHGGLAIAIGGVAVVAIVVGFVAFTLQVTRGTSVPRWVVVFGATLFALPVLTVLVAVGLTLSIVVAFAQRAIAVEDIGPIDALQSGWLLTRAHLGDSLMTWLINIGLAIATAITFGLGVVGALVLLVGIGAVVFAVAGFTAPTLAYIGLGGLVLLVGVLTLSGIANAFFWTYWTLAYLKLSGRAVAS